MKEGSNTLRYIDLALVIGCILCVIYMVCRCL